MNQSFAALIAIGCFVVTASLSVSVSAEEALTLSPANAETELADSAQNSIIQPSIRGQWIQGGVLVGQTVIGDRIEFLGRQVSISDEGFFVLGLGRDFPASATVTVNRGGQSQAFEFDVEQRDYKIQRVDGVPKRTVTPDPKHLTRIRKESAAAREARKPVTDLQHYRQTFQWPLLGRISGVYGSQRYYNGQPRRPHFGVDVAAPTGTLVQAPADGVVTLAYDDMFFSGGTLIIDHGHGLSSSFLHLSKILVEEGESITQGQAIAEVGATGRVTGPHLDWRMNWYDQRVDPQTLVPSMSEAQAQAQTEAKANVSTGG
jgi:murein DD-endopeptidase MepM/ murein hydrolase activator NlpD